MTLTINGGAHARKEERLIGVVGYTIRFREHKLLKLVNYTLCNTVHVK